MRLACKIIAAVCVCACFAVGQTPAVLQPDPIQLVRKAVANELAENARSSEFWRYRLTKQTQSGTQVRDMVETKEGIVARVISVNGRPLTVVERTADDQRLEHFLQTPSEQARKRSDQQKETNRFLSLIRMLPDALIYTYDGTEQIDGRDAVRLKFRPNPAFRSNSVESIIFRAAEGFLWIDSAERRIAKFQGSETSGVAIGWGLLGHIDKGSKVELDQRRIEEGKWRLSALTLQGSGQILLFKSVTMNQRQWATGFAPVPADLNLAQAVYLLKRQDSNLARGEARSLTR